MRSFMICSSHRYYLDDHIKENNMDGACGLFVEEEKCKQGYDEKTLRNRPTERPRHRWKNNIKVILKI
jgi:hypothetical protein